MEQVHELESAILERANRLAVEYRERAGRSRDNILQEAHKRLHLREEREVLLAKSKAERTFRRQVQAHELKLQKEMDHLRWNLVMTVKNQLRERTRALVEDEKTYLPLLRSLMISAARDFERQKLVASFNSRDLSRVQPIWDEFTRSDAADKQIILNTTPITCAGGVIISSEDGLIRFDNSFEGREERLADRLHQLILERLFPAGTLQDNLSSMR
ncbi:V-type ATP synthase subunit E [Sedimenticola selenatireducens]|uniref:V-type ATP synthase subunit E n=1 Tax=Sedimenticola selenatireducens TaxID=191960 RepID=A0A2N6CX25_9GAMM|nr:V-type ATP synthase subunit E family protein [Sedimenticola selenatireducens]PLX61825.1 MAG: V-type ATP synthase subunit E [Sedimenticola selenatireducens]